jgi:hypothetical protein
MNPLAMELTSVQMLAAAVAGFVVLVAFAVWFYRSVSAEDEQKPVAPAKKTPASARPFIPVVRPPKNVHRPKSPPAASGSFGGADIVREGSPAPPQVASTPQRQSPPTLDLSAEFSAGSQGEAKLIIKARRNFPHPNGRDLAFDLNFVLADKPTVQVRKRYPLGGMDLALSYRLIPLPRPADQEWFLLLNLSPREILFPKAGQYLVRIDCSAVISDTAAIKGGSTHAVPVLCSASAEVTLTQEGMGYEDLDKWLAAREAALGVIAGCAAVASPEREGHREIILRWISSECATLEISLETRKSFVGSLLACLGSCQMGEMPTAEGCAALVASVGSTDPLLASLGEVFGELAGATTRSVDPLNRIEHACHWLKIPIPAACGQVWRRAGGNAAPVGPATSATPIKPVPPPTPQPVKPRPQPPVTPTPVVATPGSGVPFAVSVKLIGAGESAQGFRVFVSGDLPTATSPDVQVAVSVVDKDDDAKRAFLTLPDDIDVIGQVLLPKTVFPHAQYDARAPRQVAEILFADCAYPRSGERTLRVIGAAYAVAPDGSLTHLCSTEISAPIKLPGVGYVLQQKRRRIQRGLALQLALATVGFAGPVALAQKSLVKDWIDAEAAKINDQEEARLTVNYLTKILLKADPVTHAELIALAIELAGRGNRSLSGQAIQLAEKLLGVKAGSESIVAPYLVKVRQELGLPVKAGASPVNRPIKSPPPKAPKASPPAPSRPSASPAVRRALTLNRKLGRSVPGWSAMKPEGKVAHLREELWLNSSRMASKNGLSERHELQLQINDLAELVVLIRNGQV